MMEEQRIQDDRLERVAAHCHDEQWSGWMEYLFSKCEFHEDGSATIPAYWADRWGWQSNVKYHELTEAMKESDRTEAREILEITG